MRYARLRGGVGRAVASTLALVGSFIAMALCSSPVSAAGLSIAILSPADNAIIGNGTPVTVAFITSNFNLTEPGAGGPDPNAGHVQVFLDGTLYALTSDSTFRLDVESGRHLIRLRLVSDNGTGLTPDVNATVAFTSTHGPAVGAPGIAITFPAEGAQRGPDTSVSYTLTNFALVPPGAAPDVPNEGHIEVFLDGSLYQELTVYEPAHFSDVKDGDHVATLRLVDSAHRPLSPDVSASLTFHVAATPLIDISPELAVANLLLGAVAVVALMYPVRGHKR